MPSYQALLIQLAALLAVAVAIIFFKLAAGIIQPVFVWASLVGIVAAVLSIWRRMHWWWVAIELMFAPTVFLVNMLSIPPSLFLVVFLLLLGIFWSTGRTQVPLFISGPRVWHAVEALLPRRSLRCIDVGSGVGGLVLALAHCRPDCTFFGVEIAPLPWLISSLRARWLKSTARFTRQDYRSLNFADYDVIFAYLSPAAMPGLWQQAVEQMAAGSMLISYQFGLAEVPPDQVCQLESDHTTLYVWHPAEHRASRVVDSN